MLAMSLVTAVIIHNICTFKPGACVCFLQIAFVYDICMRLCACACVCVFTPEAINNYSHEMKP